jgi:peroxiredoxin
METVAVVIRVALAAAFVLAALGKLRDPHGLRVAARQLGLRQPLADIVSSALPVVELALAVGLLVGRTAPAALGGCALLLVAFSALLAVNLARGNRPSCNCFGSASTRPIGAHSLVRNGLLLFLCATSLSTGTGPGAVGFLQSRTHGLADLQALVAGLTVVVALQMVALVHLLLRTSRTAPSMQGSTSALALGSAAPDFQLTDLMGDRRALADALAAGLPTLLVFVDPACIACMGLLPEIADWQASLSSSLTLLVVTRGSARANKEKVADLAVQSVLLQRTDEVARAYGVDATPAGVLISGDGHLAETVVVGAAEIRRLVESAAMLVDNLGPTPEPPPIGDPAPVFTLRGLDGEEVSLAEHRGRLTLLVHWSPTCVFCRELHTRLRAWEDSLDPETGPRLIILSSGSPAAHRADGFRSPTVIESSDLTRRAFGFEGTPEGILLDANGNVASPKVVGADEVIGLAAQAQAIAATADRLEARRIPVSAITSGSGGYGTEATEQD